ncbi:MAG: hypothetical protein HQL72_12120 [Magnetococcales bacterium]|nr:hypothetical protein [Magnetococcales bacterium]
MSAPKKSRPKVPDGKTKFFTTRQKAANEKGFVGYETIWVEMQKVAQYQTPKRP